MKKILSIIFMLGFVIAAQAQLLVTDSTFSTGFFGGPLAFTGTDSSYHDALNCRVAYRYSKIVSGGQLQNSTYTTYDYYPNGNLRQTVIQQWNTGTATYNNSSRTTNTYYLSTTKPAGSLTETWNGSAWQNSTLDTSTYDANGFRIKNLNQRWNVTMSMWSTTDSTVYYNNAAGLADSSIKQEFDPNGAPTDKSKQIYTYVTGTPLVSQEINQTFVNNLWQDSSRYTFYYGINRLDSLHGEFYDPGSGTFILAARQINDYNAQNQVIVATQYVVYQIFTLTTQTRFNYTPCNILPVTLLDLKAEKQKNEVLLRWSTASESNSAYFDVQRSTDNTNFVSVGRVAAAGNSNAKQYYQFTDNVGSVAASKYIFYRLRQVDKDDKFMLSPIVFVTITSSGRISIAPNPARDRVSVLHDNSINLTNSFITITDASGKTVLRQKFRDESIQLSSFKKGLYIIRITSNTGTITRKLVIE